MVENVQKIHFGHWFSLLSKKFWRNFDEPLLLNQGILKIEMNLFSESFAFQLTKPSFTLNHITMKIFSQNPWLLTLTDFWKKMWIQSYLTLGDHLELDFGSALDKDLPWWKSKLWWQNCYRNCKLSRLAKQAWKFLFLFFFWVMPMLLWN